MSTESRKRMRTTSTYNASMQLVIGCKDFRSNTMFRMGSNCIRETCNHHNTVAKLHVTLKTYGMLLSFYLLTSMSHLI